MPINSSVLYVYYMYIHLNAILWFVTEGKTKIQRFADIEMLAFFCFGAELSIWHGAKTKLQHMPFCFGTKFGISFCPENRIARIFL